MDTTSNKPTDDGKKPYSNQLNIGEILPTKDGQFRVDEVTIVDVISPTKSRIQIKFYCDVDGLAPPFTRIITVNGSAYCTPTGIAWS